MTHPAPYPAAAMTWEALAGIFPVQGPGSVLNFVTHEHDLSIELYFDALTPDDWLPTPEQFQAICTLGFATVYGIFPDDTEIIGSWRTRLEQGVRVPGADYWAMGTKREPVGTPRYQAGVADRCLTLRGTDLPLFREFLAWKAAR